MKRCSLCADVKPLDEFNRDAGRKDGHTSRCTDCINAAKPEPEIRYRLPTAAWLVQREDWQQQGACYRTGALRFFPPQGGDSRTPKAICRDCPVQFQCLEYAMRTNQRYGVWGGKSEKERRRIRSERREQGAVA